MAATTTPQKKPRSAAPKIPAVAPKPKDHLPAKSDVKADTIAFEYEGDTYTVETDTLDDVEILERLDRSTFNPVGALRMMLGLEQWDRFKESTLKRTGSTKVTVTETTEFLQVVLDAIKSGNS